MLIASVLISGCMLRVAYEQLDWLTLWYADDYLDLSKPQKATAKAAIVELLDWHRTTQLPRYLQISNQLLEQIGKPMSPAFLECEFNEFVGVLDDSLLKVSPDIAALLESLGDAQVTHLSARLARENKEMESDYSGSSREERRRKQDKAIMRVFRRYVGRLDGTQEEMIRKATAEFHDLSAEWLQRRTQWQNEFRQLLDVRKTDPDFAARVTTLFVDQNQFDSPDYRRRVEENKVRAFAMIADVLGSLSDAQTRHLRKRLATDSADMAILIRRGANHPDAGEPAAPDRSALSRSGSMGSSVNSTEKYRTRCGAEERT
ncbi:MAG: DUF6279 family lipoprotein [Gammaproteobacteria bacterium]